MVPENFKDAMSCVPNSVSIVAAFVQGQVVGCTISSLVSVDVVTPKVLFVLKNDSSTLKALSGTSIFSISVLAENQGDIALMFSSASKEHPLDTWSFKEDGSLGLNGSLVHFSCSVEDLYTQGSASIVIARVIYQGISHGLKPLVYRLRSFGSYIESEKQN